MAKTIWVMKPNYRPPSAADALNDLDKYKKWAEKRMNWLDAQPVLVRQLVKEYGFLRVHNQHHLRTTNEKTKYLRDMRAKVLAARYVKLKA